MTETRKRKRQEDELKDKLDALEQECAHAEKKWQDKVKEYNALLAVKKRRKEEADEKEAFRQKRRDEWTAVW
jgi:hypothetical protein